MRRGPDTTVVLSNTGFERYADKRARILALLDEAADNRPIDPETGEPR